ncbi:MAG: hypothetical protein ABI579_09085, partial [Candidatus Sumerlaeota bacterium]
MQYSSTDDSEIPDPSPVAHFLAYHRAPLAKRYSLREAMTFRRWSPMGIAQAIILALACLYLVAQASVHWIAVIDDSYITFRFVDMFTHGHGWRFSPEGPRVEGFTNFLWAVSLIPPHLLHWDLMATAKIYGLICAIATIFGSFFLAREIRGRNDLINLIPPIFLATNDHFSHWAMMGMETLLQVGLIIWAYYRFEAERRDLRRWQISPLLCVLAAMTRIDSLYYLAPLGLYGAWLVLWCRIPIKRMFWWGALAAVPFGTYWIWKFAYFGDTAPNTYYAKQRLVPLGGSARPMGTTQLYVYYFDQAAFKSAVPPEFAQINPDSPTKIHDYLARIAWWIAGGTNNSLIWMNTWMCGALLSMAAMTSGVIARFAKLLQSNWLLQFDDVQFGKIGCLIILPWIMNVFFIYHVNGDWMPDFRFFQIVQPIIGV